MEAPADNHHLAVLCHGCNESIVGIRYQCGNCASLPTPYCLCSTCEERYGSPAGPAPGSADPDDPKEYLKSLVHTSTVCDQCMTCIRGSWFRCAYCAKDLCNVCEEVDTHNDSHVFLVFKSIVDMQAFKHFADLENPNGSPPVITYPIYR